MWLWKETSRQRSRWNGQKVRASHRQTAGKTPSNISVALWHNQLISLLKDSQVNFILSHNFYVFNVILSTPYWRSRRKYNWNGWQWKRNARRLRHGPRRRFRWRLQWVWSTCRWGFCRWNRDRIWLGHRFRRQQVTKNSSCASHANCEIARKGKDFALSATTRDYPQT